MSHHGAVAPLEQTGSSEVRRFQEGIDAMTAALGTLVFLTMMWLLVVIGAAVLEESGAKIAAALKGNSAINPVQTMPVRMRIRPRLRQPMRATAELRVAA